MFPKQHSNVEGTYTANLRVWKRTYPIPHHHGNTMRGKHMLGAQRAEDQSKMVD